MLSKKAKERKLLRRFLKGAIQLCYFKIPDEKTMITKKLHYQIYKRENGNWTIKTLI